MSADAEAADGGERDPSAGSSGAVSDAVELVSAARSLGLTVGVAESLTGGLLAAAIVAVPGASAVFRGGVVAYATDLKASLLGVDGGLLEREGAVHPDVALQMARGIRETVTGAAGVADIGVSTTGVAGPDPADGQPVGTVYIAVSAKVGETVQLLDLDGSREQIREQTVTAALRLARDVVKSAPGDVSTSDDRDAE